ISPVSPEMQTSPPSRQGPSSPHAEARPMMMTAGSVYGTLMGMSSPTCSRHANPGTAMGLALLIISGCGTEEPPRPATCADFSGATELPDIPLRYSTEYLDIYVSEDQIMCAGTPVEYERFHRHVANELSITPTERVPLFIMSPGGHCPPDVAACRTSDGVVFSPPGYTWHELTHAVGCAWRHSSAPPLSEGLATVFEPSPLTAK